MIEDGFRAELLAAQERSVSHGLLKAGRLVDELGIARVRERWGAPLRRAHTRLFPYLDLEGTRPSEVARRVGISKQAASVLIDELLEMGVLERTADPSDGRAWLVRFARRRGRSVLDGLTILAEIDQELESALGSAGMRQLLQQLTRALQALEALAPAQASPDR